VTNTTPNTPTVSSTVDNSIKIATRDIILFEEDQIPVDLMTDLIFENIGGQELINISRNDLVNGQNIIYQPIRNLTSINFQYNPQNILSLQNTDVSYFKKFSINFNNKVPECGTGNDCNVVYIEESTGDLVINVVNMLNDEQVEVQILSNGLILNDTIYGGE
jgi:hypothetical protein